MALGKAAQHRCIRKVFSSEESEALLHFVLLLYRTHFTPFQYLLSFPHVSCTANVFSLEGETLVPQGLIFLNFKALL